MDQKKVGAFLKTLRTEKGMTQEQLAEQFNVSGRTVSRWETGSNMPDLATLIEISDFHNLDIREIIDGERKSETMNEETKETVKKVAEYADADKKRLEKRMIDLSAGALLLLIFANLLLATDGFGRIPVEPCENLVSFSNGLAVAILGLNIVYLMGGAEKLKKIRNKLRRR